MDIETSDIEDFVTMDYNSISDKRSVLVVEAKRSDISQTVNQCLLSIKDMWDTNRAGEVYGFTTTGDDWRMFSYKWCRVL